MINRGMAYACVDRSRGLVKGDAFQCRASQFQSLGRAMLIDQIELALGRILSS